MGDYASIVGSFMDVEAELFRVGVSSKCKSNNSKGNKSSKETRGHNLNKISQKQSQKSNHKSTENHRRNIQSITMLISDRQPH